MVLTPEQIRQFYEVGFVVLTDVFDPREVARVAASFAELENVARSFRTTTEHQGSQFVVQGDRIDRIVWCAGVEPSLLEIAGDVRLLLPVSELLGSEEMSQLICQAHFKLPGDGVAFSWHQDSQHRKYGTDEWRDVNGRGSYVQTLIAIDEMTESNGPVVFMPRSCQLGHLGEEGVQRVVAAAKPEDFFTLKLKPGSLALFGPYAIHGSEPNRSKGPRRVLINGYAYPGANSRVYPGAGLGRPVSLAVQAEQPVGALVRPDRPTIVKRGA